MEQTDGEAVRYSVAAEVVADLERLVATVREAKDVAGEKGVITS